MKISRYIALAVAFVSTATAQAQTQVPNEFQSGQPARATEVNENFTALEGAIDQNTSRIVTVETDVAGNASEIADHANQIQGNTAAIAALSGSPLDAEIQTAIDYGRRGLSSGDASLNIIGQLVRTLGLTCAEANYGRFYGCTQLTSGDGTVYPIEGIIYELAVAYFTAPGVPSVPGMLNPTVFGAQAGSGDQLLLGGTANFLRWTYREADDVARLVDNCDSPTVAMSPISTEGTSSRWRVNNGGYYYAPVDESSGSWIPTGQIDVTGQLVGIIKNINPNMVFDAGSVVWCEMSDQVTGLYNTYDLRPYPFNLNEVRFSQPITVN
jgi:hypothetical protein